MPFIKGRYHINPAMGEALEAARDAESALLALEEESRRNSGEPSDQACPPSGWRADRFASPHADDAPEPGPIHRIEIDASETVPTSTGRAQRGFVARIHRAAPTVSDVIPRSPDAVGATRNPSSTAVREIPHSVRDDSPQASRLLPPETHVFSDHRDLLDFLRDQLAQQSRSSS